MRRVPPLLLCPELPLVALIDQLTKKLWSLRTPGPGGMVGAETTPMKRPKELLFLLTLNCL